MDQGTPICAGLYRMAIYSYLGIGPLLYLYAKGIMQPFFQFHKRHLIPFVVSVIVFFMPFSFLIHPIRFYGVQMWLLIYLILTLTEVYKSKENTDRAPILKDKGRWIYVVAGCVFIIWMAALTRSHIELIAFFSFLVLAMVYIIIDKKEVIRFERPDNSSEASRTIAKNDTDYKGIMKQVEELMIHQQVFLNSDMNLPLLADQLGISLHTLSKCINSQTGKNFSEYINSFRIDQAILLLTDQKNEHLNIAGIAFECGFNSLSTFNTTFKRMKGVTPSVYRKSNR